MSQGFWVRDNETGEDRLILYSDLDKDLLKQVIKPVGGFIFPASAFMAYPLANAPFYVQDWLPKRGKSLLYAPAKSGKSYLCLQLARCVGVGEPFIGIPTTRGRVLYIQFELGEEILQARLKQTCKEYEDVFVGTSFSVKLDTVPGQEQVRTALEAVEPNVVIFDPLYKALSGDENESHDIMPVLDYLDSLIEGYDCSILVIHHAGKDISKHGRGSSVLEDWVDSYLQMQKTSKDGEPLKVKIKPIFLRHAANPPEPIEAVLTDFEFARVGKEPTVKEQVLAYLKEFPSAVSPAQLFAAEIGSNTSVYGALKELIKECKVTQPERGKYVAT